MPRVSAEEAVRVAQRFARSSSTAHHDGTIELDLWTVSPGLQPVRPLHRIALNDAEHTVLYVSALTGEVVRDTNRSERILNFFGCVVHWIYPSWLRRHTGAWRLTIQILSGAAFLVPLTGLVIGLPRLRIAWRQMHGARRWHILLGGVCGIPAQTWFHIDPASGKLTERLTRRSRTYRWLFNGLHSFDWPWLAQRRPLWDAVVLVTLGGGLGLCLLGLRLAWRRISPRRAFVPRTEQPQP